MRSTLVTEHAGQMLESAPPAEIRDIDLLLADYVAQHKTSRDSGVLHVTDITECPRKVMLKMSGAVIEMDPLYLAKRTYMFHVADVHHDEIYEALHLEGSLIACELRLHELGLLPEGWHGTLDMLVYRLQRRIGDVKTNHPNFIRYSRRVQEGIPKPGDAQQVKTYELFAGRALGTEADPFIVHKDRGGQNRSVEITVPMPRHWIELRDKLDLGNLTQLHADVLNYGWYDLGRIVERMLFLERVRDDQIPQPPLPRCLYYDESYAKNGHLTKVEIYQQQDWRCGEPYCDYSGTEHCTPAEKRKQGIFVKEAPTWRWRTVRGASKDLISEAIQWAGEGGAGFPVSMEGAEE